MKSAIYLVFFLATSLILVGQDRSISSIKLLSQREAAELVAAQEKSKEKQKADFKALLKSADAIDESSFYKDGRRVLHRRIKASRKPKKRPERSEEGTRTSASLVDFNPEDYRFEMLSFYVKNYDDLYSEITWRDHENNVFSIWTNVSLVHLPVLNSFKLDDVNYSYAGFSDYIDSASEKERAGIYEFHGHQHEYKSRWKDAPVVFGKEPEYVVIPENSSAVVPDELHEQMSAVLRCYLENEDTLRISHLNSKILNEERAKYVHENPPQPEESVLIYSFSPSGE